MAATKAKSKPAAIDNDRTIDVDRVLKDEAYKQRLRRRCQTDLYWLGTVVLVQDDGAPCYPDINERTHREVAEFFVHKDPTKSIAAQDRVKQRLLLMPRGTFKTTWNIIDALQWILAFPDIAIFLMTAANTDDSPLADAFLEEVAGHFLDVNGTATNLTKKTSHFYDKPNTPMRPLHALFPEYVITKPPKKGWFMTPARTKYRREPTILASSIESSLSGWHFDVAKFEDIQDNRNSQSSGSIAKVKRNLFINLKMLMSWGYREGTGTRYGPMDVYGLVIERLNINIGKVLWKPAMKVKDETLKRRPQLREKLEDYSFLFETLEEDDWELFFPEFLPYEKLMQSRDEDEHSFMTQQMNVATGGFKPTFPMEKLMAATLDEEKMPVTGSVHIKWRLEMKESNNIAGAVGLQSGGRMYVVEVLRGSWTPSTTAMKIVALAKKYSSKKIAIEETPGARHQESAIRNEAMRQRWDLTIQWLPYQVDDKERQLRIKASEPVLGTGRLFFSRDIKGLREVHRQLYHYGMIEETEIADVISRVCDDLPKLIGDRESLPMADDDAWKAIQARDQRDRVYNLGRYAPQEPQVSQDEIEAQDTAWNPPSAPDGFEDMMPGLSG